jgi:hypothetical protein
MAPRTRTQQFSSYRGDGWNHDHTVHIGGNQKIDYSSTCSDQTGPGDCAPFSVSRWTFAGGRLNKGPSQFGNEFYNYIADIFNVDANFPHGTVAGLLSNEAYAAQAVARTNPSRPYVDIPVSLAELGDVTRLIHDNGRGIIFKANEMNRLSRGSRHARNVARMNLTNQFGIQPLVGDLARLSRFGEALERRVAEIERLAGPKGLRRTVSFGGGSSYARANKDFQSNLASVFSVPCDRITTQTVTAHVRWRANPSFGALRRPGIARFLAIRSLLGLTVDASTLWEAMPWSWLFDWSASVGTYFKAQRNIVPAQLLGSWVHRATDTTWTWPSRNFSSNPTGVMSGGTFWRQSRGRSGNIPLTPTAHFPFLDGNKVGILASLSVTRRR